MVPFKNVFTGAEKPPILRAASAQKCVRAGGKHNDLDNVGYTARHHTFFEMLGNFSFGDYFKERAILLAWELLTKDFALDKSACWSPSSPTTRRRRSSGSKIAGLPDEKIIRIAGSDNFWSMGDTGPCGPCSEIFYDHGPTLPGGPPGSPDAGRRPLRRDLESRVHAIRAACRRRAHRPAQALDRHRHGARAHRRGAARDARQLRHRSVPRADRGLGRSDRRARDRRACAEPSHHRRPFARLVVPHCRRRAAVERGQGLCAAPHHAARHAACAYPRRQGPAAVSPGAGADRADGPRLSRARAGPEPDRGDAEAGGDPLPRDARARASPARRRDQGVEARRHACPARSPSSSTTLMAFPTT